MKAEISRIIKRIRTHKNLCNLLHAACEYREFNIVDIAGIMSETDELFNISSTRELSPEQYQDYAGEFLSMLYDLYSDKSEKFLCSRR